MPRSRRIVVPNCALHVVNRGNDRRCVFPQDIDYASFLALLREGRERHAVKIYGYNLVHTHFHLILGAADRAALSAYMHFVERSHACDLRASARSIGGGHVFQRRFWSAVIEGDGYFLNAFRYVEANALRASLVKRAEDWPWGSLWERQTGERDLLCPLPIRLPESWTTIVNVPQEPADLQAIRTPRKRGRPSRNVDFRKPTK